MAAPPLSLKFECLQATGSFKARGAFHNLLTRPTSAAGCTTASGGNHGAAVAFAARKLGIRARVFVPEIATPAKIAKIKAYGAEAVIGGAAYAVAQERCDAYAAESGALLIHPYDAVETIAGQGTVALEWEEDLERARPREARHGPRRGRRRRAHRRRGRLVSRPRQGRGRRAGRFARASRRARGGQAG